MVCKMLFFFALDVEVKFFGCVLVPVGDVRFSLLFSVGLFVLFFLLFFFQ